MLNITKVTVGADPEFFLYDKNTGEYVSAHDMIPGTKEAPHPVPKGAIQVDGTAVEFNIDPAHSEDEFVDNVKTVIGHLRSVIPAKYEFAYTPAVMFNRPYFEKLPRKAVELGCNPDWSGYTFQHNPIPDDHGIPMRTGSGHVHVGWEVDGVPFSIEEMTQAHILNCGRLARNLDVTLGLAARDWDRDNKRRQLYGKAGAFRPKPYGMEYRTLSNAWLRDERLMRRVYRGAVDGVKDYWTNGPACMFMQHRPDELQKHING